MLIGRETELRFLNQYYAKEGSRILVVYGQKGVGKTALLEEFTADKKTAHYYARACSEREQRYQWARELTDRGHELPKYPEYARLFEHSVLENETSKQVMIIDQFHHIVKHDPSFMEQLIRFLELRRLSRPIMVLLCTSASGWVENSMVGRMGSNAIAINGLLKVRELKFAEMGKLYPGYSQDDSMQIYAALGGIPGLWRSFSEQLSARENMIQHIIRKESRLHQELSVYMAEELREPAVYNTILAAMARGGNKLNDIYRHTGFSRAKISVYLKNLMELELVEKVYSGSYRIINPYVRFFFRFLFPNQTLLQGCSAEEFYERAVLPLYPDFVEEAYRKLCREQLGLNPAALGEWIGKEGSLDIVGTDGDGRHIVAACFYARKMTYEDYEWLLFCMKKAKLKDADIHLFCEKGVDDKLAAEIQPMHIKMHRINRD